jgi:hypothetical protein
VEVQALMRPTLSLRPQFMLKYVDVYGCISGLHISSLALCQRDSVLRIPVSHRIRTQ